jgi:hypothetical protein
VLPQLGPRDPVGGVFHQEAVHEIRKRGARRAGEGGEGGLEDGVHQLCKAAGNEGGLPCEALVEDAANGPQVGGKGVDPPLLEELRGHVAGGAALGLRKLQRERDL